MTDTMNDETALSILDKLHKANARLLSPSERLALDHIAARLAQQPAAAVADMAEFEAVMRAYSTQLCTSPRDPDYILACGNRLRTLYAQALASNAGVPEPRASAWRQALLGYWGMGLDDIAFLEQRAANIERMNGGGE